MLKLDIPLGWTTPTRTPVLHRVLREDDVLSLDDIHEMSKSEYRQFKVLQARAEYEKEVMKPGADAMDIFVARQLYILKIDFLNTTLK